MYLQYTRTDTECRLLNLKPVLYRQQSPTKSIYNNDLGLSQEIYFNK
jgi:hypothetical protein